MTLSTMTLSTTTLSIMPLCTMKLSITTLSIMTLTLSTLSITTHSATTWLFVAVKTHKMLLIFSNLIQYVNIEFLQTPKVWAFMTVNQSKIIKCK
jgi:hypothetical protein